MAAVVEQCAALLGRPISEAVGLLTPRTNRPEERTRAAWLVRQGAIEPKQRSRLMRGGER